MQYSKFKARKLNLAKTRWTFCIFDYKMQSLVLNCAQSHALLGVYSKKESKSVDEFCKQDGDDIVLCHSDTSRQARWVVKLATKNAPLIHFVSTALSFCETVKKAEKERLIFRIQSDRKSSRIGLKKDKQMQVNCWRSFFSNLNLQQFFIIFSVDFICGFASICFKFNLNKVFVFFCYN